ncbi:GPI-anchored surface protein, putative, partial [Bodo saltans]
MFRALLLLLMIHHYVVVSQKVSVWTSVSTFPVVTGTCLGVIEDSTTTPASLVYLSHQACGVMWFTPTSTSAQLVAGGSGTCAFADSTVGSSARFNNPTDITSNTLNTVAYISDRDNRRVRVVDLATGAVTTLAGSGITGNADGVGSLASFYLIYGIVYHKSAGGTLYVADNGSGRIRKVVISTKNVSTVSTGGCTYLYVTNDGLWLFASSGHAIVRVRISTGETTLLAGSTTVASY